MRRTDKRSDKHAEPQTPPASADSQTMPTCRRRKRPQQALARIDIPQDAIDSISQMMVPGSSLIVSDQGLGDETGDGTDFIVVTR